MAIITNFKPAAKAPGAYAQDVKELAEAGGVVGSEVAFPLEIVGEKDDESGAWHYPATELTKFQTAAREAGFSAKVVRTDVDEKAHKAVKFIQLADRRTRTPKSDKVVTEAP